MGVDVTLHGSRHNDIFTKNFKMADGADVNKSRVTKDVDEAFTVIPLFA